MIIQQATSGLRNRDKSSCFSLMLKAIRSLIAGGVKMYFSPSPRFFLAYSHHFFHDPFLLFFASLLSPQKPTFHSSLRGLKWQGL